MKNKVRNLILFGGFVFLLLLLIPAISKAACANVPMGGNYTVSSSCTFANTVDGVDDGGITVNAGVTLTINAGQTIVWSPGHSIVINGAIAIADGGQLKQTYLWMTDADNDGRPASVTMYAQDTQPTNGKRRKDFTSFTYVDDITADCNDSDSARWQNRTCYYDGDNDGYRTTASATRCVGSDCTNSTDAYKRESTASIDCNDSNSYIYREKAVGTDTDHDGYISESSTSTQCVGASTSINGRYYYKDSSGNYTKLSSSYVVGYSDCNDSNSTKWVYKYKDSDGDDYCASSTKYCVGSDSGYTSSCSGYSDCNDSDATKFQNLTCYPDSDGDSYYSSSGTSVCTGSSCPSGYSGSAGTDCNDSDATRWQNRTCYYDGDNDGYRTTASATRCVGANCTNSTDAYKLESTASVDCDDTDGTKYQNLTCYPDADGDSHYSPSGTSLCTGSSCPSGYSGTAGDDCDDSCATCYPGSAAYTTSPDGLDQDCDGTADDIEYSYNVRLNSASGISCNTLCSNNGEVCVDVGDDSSGTNNRAWICDPEAPVGCACTDTYKQFVCNDSMSNAGATCGSYQAWWTYCRCRLTKYH